MDHRREVKRRSLRGSGVFLVRPSVGLATRMLDISTKGVGFVAPSSVVEGTPGVLQFSVPAPDARSRPFEARIVVVDCVLSGKDQGFRIGAQFEPELHIDTRDAIETYVG